MTAETTNGSAPAAAPAAATAATPRTKICVFCGASPGKKPEYVEAARALARSMAANNIDLVYGGGTVGLMGEVAKTLCELRGPDAVHGIIPEALVKFERDGTYATVNAEGRYVPDEAKYGRTTVVPDMHTRKALMAEEVFAGGPGSGFVGLPGGFGTMEELFEVITWNQLGIHAKGIVLLNVGDYWRGMLDLIDTAVDQGFIRDANKNIVLAARDGDQAIAMLRDYKVSEAIYGLEWGKQ
ncbi:hypothetical protein V2A60_008184 [Cordyceps javanica]|uniref:Lysine decarboxylase-like protein n=1 Tax=Cordyceps javanica TaxID=43265 RepID=A0A545UNG0_9HYPO|nr:lysine decarboxylase-like protein [Cordyceps javanica]TQW02752.1 lysine decarboxylase-like protein [Cordyceps javanica]